MIGMIQNFHHTKKIGKRLEKNNNTIALNLLFALYNTKQLRPAYVSKHNSDRENQVILLMITDYNNILKYNSGEKYMRVPFIL